VRDAAADAVTAAAAGPPVDAVRRVLTLLTADSPADPGAGPAADPVADDALLEALVNTLGER
jgi:hypothetical protein